MWEALHRELAPKGLTVVTVALDVDPSFAWPFVDVVDERQHVALVDQAHITDELFGFCNVPMAVWIDETGTLVRPAELATLERSALKDAPIPDGLPDRVRIMLTEVKQLRDQGDAYRDAVVDWAEHGAASRFALTPDEVVARSQPRPFSHAEAAACFELGQHLWHAGQRDAAVPWWKRAHALHPENFTYKRNAWTFVTTPEGAAEPDLFQGPNDVYEGNWLDDVLALGGGANYYPPGDL